VRALIERGKVCWGFDHSRWAIDHAEDAARPFLVQAAAADVSFDREFDVLLAFDLLSHLDQPQAESFLRRARDWIRNAVVALTPSFETADDERRFADASDNRDFSQITMRSRAWWHALFLKSGWRQDALHKVAERACQSHALPRKMSWNVYVYSPR